MARKTGKDYRKELEEVSKQKEALEARIIKRAKELCKQCPNMPVSTNFLGYVNITTGDYVKIDDLHVLTALSLIEMIEADLASKHPHKQTKINF